MLLSFTLILVLVFSLSGLLKNIPIPGLLAEMTSSYTIFIIQGGIL